MFPAAAVTSAGLAFESARASAELAEALASVGLSLPRAVATCSVANNEACGRSVPATALRARAGANGDNAAPSGVFCVAWARRAEPDATSEGLLFAASERSILADCPMPAVPPNERVMAILEASGLGCPAPSEDGCVATLAAVKLADGAWLAVLREGEPVCPATCVSTAGGAVLLLRRRARVAAWLPDSVAATAPAGRAMSAAALDADCRATAVAVAAGEPAAVELAAVEGGAATAATEIVGCAPERVCRCKAELLVSTVRGAGTDSARRRVPVLATAVAGDCTTAGEGSETARAACGLAVACCRVATLVGDTSLVCVWRTAPVTCTACVAGVGSAVAGAARATLAVVAGLLAGAGCGALRDTLCAVVATSVGCDVEGASVIRRSTGVCTVERSKGVVRASAGAGC